MKPSATGRILFWRGGSLWIGLAGEPSGWHSHHAVQLTLPFPECRVRFQEPEGRWVDYTAALVVADHPHAFEARGQRVAQIFVDPESRDGRLMWCPVSMSCRVRERKTLDNPLSILVSIHRRQLVGEEVRG